jgi:S-adenosylmethionine hydrolase
VSIVTLLTDFGTTDSYVAEMKGAVLRGAPSACLVDISHHVPPGDIRSAQYLLARTWRSFPPATVHLVVVDPGVGTARRAIAASAGNHLFVAPDNGLLTPVLERARVVEIDVPPDASSTFHGRDVFAPTAARLAGDASLDAIGQPVFDAASLPLPLPVSRGDGVAGEVVYVDRFGNLITNIPGERCGSASVQLGATTLGAVRRTFGDVRPAELVAYVGSAGTLEIGMRDGSAADELEVGVGAEVRVVASGS